jgi:hypothetical protein
MAPLRLFNIIEHAKMIALFEYDIPQDTRVSDILKAHSI